MTHLWVRAEQRPNEERVGLTPEGAAALIAKGIKVTVEQSHVRAIPIEGYRAAGCAIAPENSWPQAPVEAIIFGLKELPEDGTPLPHRHIMFGHAFKGQHSGRRLLERFKAGGGTLYDLEYLVDEGGRRVAAFGYWAGYAGAAVSLMAWAAAQAGESCAPVATFGGRDALLDDLRARLDAAAKDVDVILTSGGASAGDEDHVSALLTEAGAMALWRIAVKPGRPLALGLWQGVPVFGLPGNPVAAMVCTLIFARPAMALLAGSGWTEPQGFDVPAAFEKRKKPGRREYLRARMRDGRAEVFASEGSGRISGLSWAEGLIELDEAARDIKPGDAVRFIPYGSFTG
jgi:hypothetical protein